MARVIIVGAGLAGLTCGKVLKQRGVTDLQILEKEAEVGGRVRTDQWQGFHLDRGFQVLFAAYPSVRRHLDLPALAPRAYRPGAVLVRQGHPYLIGDPLRDPTSLVASLRNPLIPIQDKLRVFQLRLQLWRQSPEQIFASPDGSTWDFIQTFGFSPQMAHAFFLPFYRGILLDPDLGTSARLFKFYFKMLAEGAVVTPRLGLGQIPQQLARHLDPDQIRCGTEVTEVFKPTEATVAVRTTAGETLEADFLVWATDGLTTNRLLGLAVPATPRSVTCCYFSSPLSLTQGGYIHLNATGQGQVNSCVQLTHISPDLAPAGQHLYSLVVLGEPCLSEQDLAASCRAELQDWFPRCDLTQLQFLRSYRIPFAQFDQPPGSWQHRPAPLSPMPGVILAGEYTQHSSIEGAMASGEVAAELLISQINSESAPRVSSG